MYYCQEFELSFFKCNVFFLTSGLHVVNILKKIKTIIVRGLDHMKDINILKKIMNE